MAAFSFRGCIAAWEEVAHLRRSARKCKLLVQDVQGRKHVCESLANIKLNAELVRPITRTMAEYGRIHKPIDLIKDAFVDFYKQQMQGDEDINLENPETMRCITQKASSSANVVKKMLTVIKRKWSLWELPRAAQHKFM